MDTTLNNYRDKTFSFLVQGLAQDGEIFNINGCGKIGREEHSKQGAHLCEDPGQKGSSRKFASSRKGQFTMA